MRRDVWTVAAPSLSGEGHVIAYGHWGAPVLFFPAEGGSAVDLEERGVIHALAEPIEAGRLKVYAVDSHDGSTWSNHSLELEERARRHEALPRSGSPTRSRRRSTATAAGRCPSRRLGPASGAFHAVNLALRRADLFPHALGHVGQLRPDVVERLGEHAATRSTSTTRSPT